MLSRIILSVFVSVVLLAYWLCTDAIRVKQKILLQEGHNAGRGYIMSLGSKRSQFVIYRVRGMEVWMYPYREGYGWFRKWVVYRVWVPGLALMRII